jgi:hypothetical protein
MTAKAKRGLEGYSEISREEGEGTNRRVEASKLFLGDQVLEKDNNYYL